jgi:hypothetical protein
MLEMSVRDTHPGFMLDVFLDDGTVDSIKISKAQAKFLREHGVPGQG